MRASSIQDTDQACIKDKCHQLIAPVCMVINKGNERHMRPHVERAEAAALTCQRASCSRLSVSSPPAPPQER